MTSPERSAIMRAVKSRDTGAELAVRAMLREIAPGYRLNRADLPGKPDIVYGRRRLAIFVHGCFWHGHDCARGARMPKTNTDYWRAKIARNRARDLKTLDRTRRDGLAHAGRPRMRIEDAGGASRPSWRGACLRMMPARPRFGRAARFRAARSPLDGAWASALVEP